MDTVNQPIQNFTPQPTSPPAQTPFPIQLPQQLPPGLILQILAGITFFLTLINLAYSGTNIADFTSSILTLLIKSSYLGAISACVGLFLLKRWAVYLFIGFEIALIVLPATIGVLQIGSILFKCALIGIVYYLRNYTR